MIASCKTQSDQVVKDIQVKNAAVSSAHALASQIGVDIMKQGGNAVDAAIAVQFALAVVYPIAGNIGGGGFMIYREPNGESYALDYREIAPKAATEDMYQDSLGNVIPKKSTHGLLAGGVPGTVDGMDQVGINRDFNVFEFRSALGKKDLSKAMQIANYFGDNSKSHPIQMILPSVFAYFLQIFQAKSFAGGADAQLARAIGVNPYFVSEYKAAAKMFSLEHMKQIFSKLSETDLLSKGVGARKSKDKDLLQDLVFTIIK